MSFYTPYHRDMNDIKQRREAARNMPASVKLLLLVIWLVLIAVFA